LEVVQHLDGNRANNALSNLMLVQRGEEGTGQAREPARVELVCAVCSRTFPRRRVEVNLALRRGKSKFYCSHQCSGRAYGRGKKQGDL
jgi:hypothetical protein